MQRNPTKNYEIVKEIGEGSYSKVYRAVRLSDNGIVAIKIVNISKMDKVMINSTLNEIRILNSVDDNHIVGYSEAFLDSSENNLWIVMEYMGGGDLACAIKLAKKENRTFPEKVVWMYFIQILRGLCSLNKFKIIHRDVKPANIFLTNDQKKVKLGDMNVSKVVVNDLTRTQIGTPSYLAPEIWENKPYDSRCDIYSLGVCIYEMAALRLPFEARSMDELKQKIRNNIISPLSNAYSEELKKTIFKCLAKNPSMRPTCDKLLTLPIIELKIAELEMGTQTFDNKSRLMETILMPNQMSKLKNILPKKSPHANRSSSMANLKSVDSKNDSFISSNKDFRVPTTKTEPSNVKVDSSEPERNKQVPKPIPIPQKITKPEPPIDPSKVNMIKANKKEVQLEVIANKPSTRSNSSKNLIPPSVNSKIVVPPSVNKPLNVINPKVSSGKIPTVVEKNSSIKNVPPSPPTKMDAIRKESSSYKSEARGNRSDSSGLKYGSRNNSASANKLQPVVVEKITPTVPRQGSSKNLSIDKKSYKQEPSVVLPPPKVIDKQPPMSLKGVKRPPMKSGQPPLVDNSKPQRYSTNPSNDLRMGEGSERVLKFDDFIRNFEGSNARLSKLQAQRDDAVRDGKRFNSLKQKSRDRVLNF